MTFRMLYNCLPDTLFYHFNLQHCIKLKTTFTTVTIIGTTTAILFTKISGYERAVIR